LGGGGGEFLGEDLGDVHGGPLDGCRLVLRLPEIKGFLFFQNSPDSR